MSIELLAKQGREQAHTGLAGIDSSKLSMMRNAHLKECFAHVDEMRYRMEFVARIRGIEFINDASSTTVNATWYSLENMGRNTVWIASATSAHTDYTRLRNVAARKVKMLICVGEHNEQLHKAFDGVVKNIVDVATVGEAAHKALYNDLENTTVIYSPAVENGKSIEELGERFAREVNDL
ncbi:MAG: hypothetical protein J6X62_06445 [Bacteroidales bacterium]|nr:hypothetical protein [Bacteroidales bacterium]